MDPIEKLIKDIKSVKVQGATNIALATLDGIKLSIEKLAGKNEKNVSRLIRKTALRLAYARPNEPLSQNALKYIFSDMHESAYFYLNKSEEYKRMMSESRMKIINIGADLVRDNGKYITHCHSSLAVSVFSKARKFGKRFSVYATETRPLLQGRITVTELLKKGLDDVTLVVDALVPTLFANMKIDAIFIGADVLTKSGLVNKVGSLGLSILSSGTEIPFFILSQLLKFDPATYGVSSIENRVPEEIWNNSPKGLKILNPAFDFVPFTDETRIISEEGIMEGRMVYNKAKQKYPFIFET